jgi:hypothetical protein
VLLPRGDDVTRTVGADLTIEEAIAVTPVSGQVPAWSELDVENLHDRIARMQRDGVRVGIGVRVGHLISIIRTPRGRCESCELRRVLYVVDVDGELTRRFCWACWSGGKPE